jgi:hypothetical protein
MPDNIPFSIGLESLPLDALQANNGANGNTYSSNFGTSISAGGASISADGANYTGGIIDINAPTVEDGVYITDTSLKQVYIEMTVFQSFPVQMDDGKYTYVSDKTSTGDNAGTNTGGLSHNCNAGQCGFCDKFDESILDAQIGKVPNFKIGASIGHAYGTQYLKKFYPEVAWTAGDFGALKKDGFFIAEEDLKLRGPGEIFGMRQHGMPDLNIADLAKHIKVMEHAKVEARKVIEKDPYLIDEKNQVLRRRVIKLFGQDFSFIL